MANKHTKRCSQITCHQEMQIKTRYHDTLIRKAKTQHTDNTKYWQGCWAIGTLCSLNRIQITNAGKDGNFPGSPVVKNPPSNAGDAGLILGQGSKIPHVAGQPSLRALEPARHDYRACMPQLLSPRNLELVRHQLERSPRTATKSQHATVKDPTCHN